MCCNRRSGDPAHVGFQTATRSSCTVEIQPRPILRGSSDTNIPRTVGQPESGRLNTNQLPLKIHYKKLPTAEGSCCRPNISAGKPSRWRSCKFFSLSWTWPVRYWVLGIGYYRYSVLGIGGSVFGTGHWAFSIGYSVLVNFIVLHQLRRYLVLGNRDWAMGFFSDFYISLYGDI